MTGPEHYREAERLSVSAASNEISRETKAVIAQIAQVHATLALAAATAMNDADGGMNPANYRAWCDVAGVKPPATGGPASAGEG